MSSTSETEVGVKACVLENAFCVSPHSARFQGYKRDAPLQSCFHWQEAKRGVRWDACHGGGTMMMYEEPEVSEYTGPGALEQTGSSGTQRSGQDFSRGHICQAPSQPCGHPGLGKSERFYWSIFNH